MATTKTGKSRSSNGSMSSGSAGRNRRSAASSAGSRQGRSGRSNQQANGSNASGNAQEGSGRDSPDKQASKATTGGKPMGRAPTEDPDVYVDVPEFHVGKVSVNVERLEAHLALRAQVANLLNLIAGVHVGVDKVGIEIEDVQAVLSLKVRLENTYNILDRTLTTLDENPEIARALLETAGNAVEQVGGIGQEATKPGGAISELTSGVGDTLGSLSDSLGDTLSSVTDKVNPTRLGSGSGEGASKAKSKSTQGSGDGVARKAATALAAAGTVGVIGGALSLTRQRPRVLGVPVGRRKGGLNRVAKRLGEASGQVKNGVRR